MSESAMLALAGTVIVLLLGVIGHLLRQDRQSIAATMAAGFAELKTLIAGVAAQAQRLERDCVTWEDFNKLRADVTCQGTEIAVIKKTCEVEHGK
jgi:hypothetical protein